MMCKVIGVLLAASFCLVGTAWASLSARLGDMEVVSLTDAQGRSPASLLVGAAEDQLARYVPGGEMNSQVLAFLVRVPGRTLLFDAGLGTGAGGRMMDELKGIGVAPSDVDAVLLTHLHRDHFGGLADAEGKAAFPRAEVWVSRIERDWWVSERKDENAARALALYDGRLRLFEFGDEPLPGVTALDASGHTPGHTAFHVSAGGGELLVVGDVLHFAEIQLPLPQIAVTYDADPAKAPEARRRLLDRAAESGVPVAGMHFPVPGLWRIARSGEGYEKSPLE